MTAQPAAALSKDERGGGTDKPVVVFGHVSLAFDDNVVLREISFSVLAGHMAILLGASGAGKSVVLKLILGLRASQDPYLRGVLSGWIPPLVG